MEESDSVLVYPEAKVGINEALIRLHKLDLSKIDPPTDMDGTASGFVAYSALCTHLGCTVDWDDSNETATGRPTDHCYCHGSQFDRTKEEKWCRRLRNGPFLWWESKSRAMEWFN